MRAFLDTGRLVLRPFTGDEADDLFALDDDPDVMRFVNGGRPAAREAIRTRTLPQLLHDHPGLGTRGYWAAEDGGSGAFLGWFKFLPVDEHSASQVELGFRLRRAAWGKGYATEGSRALIAKGFTDLGVERVTATAMAVHARSRRVLEKAGLALLRTFHGDWPAFEGSEHGSVEYALTRAAWEEAARRPAEHRR
ncbi:MAG: GNAT family N-acetyltransferase [Streptomyces sp.]|nr:GNAT family N-acetyltransferase [Streptomyces sp.]